ELSFEDADLGKFPVLSLAYDALEEGGTMPAVMNAANEMAVQHFLKGDLKFLNIIKVVKQVMNLHKTHTGGSLDEILESDNWARSTAESIINRM
ncbi:MAG TPA: 1-deoxy-D-xylulose-5-phosphate reductoisomerase, partial [Thermodesulfobacteriota bacterium]|nr:1-deoxy-D-xylulose-5-phosphate reductoisomerase [Thermodesulfobacteriota bacterium]